MTGYDKANFDEREARAMEHLEDVFDSADNPLTVSFCFFLLSLALGEGWQEWENVS